MSGSCLFGIDILGIKLESNPFWRFSCPPRKDERNGKCPETLNLLGNSTSLMYQPFEDTSPEPPEAHCRDETGRKLFSLQDAGSLPEKKTICWACAFCWMPKTLLALMWASFINTSTYITRSSNDIEYE
jgi:hypothetical protein